MSQLMGDRIKQCRLHAHMTQEELGNRLGVQKSAIRKYEKGVVDNIPRSRIALMADIFGVDPVWLMGFDNDDVADNKMGIRIKQLRLQANMTQEELGKVIGVNKAAIQKYESGQTTNMKRSKIAAMSKFFKVSPTWLMGFEDEEYNPDGIDSKEIRLMQDVADTFGNAARDCLIRFYKLDDVDQGKVIERMDTMLEADKYQKDEELQAN